MRTIVYQSFRTHDVPAWLERCMESVRTWARRRDYDYRFYDDELFDLAPRWYRDRVQHHVLPVTDLARLVAARDLLIEGYERTMWIDADVLVFAPDRFDVDLEGDHCFCRETWLGVNGMGYTPFPGVNNAVTSFQGGAGVVEPYIAAVERRALSPVAFHPQQAGTQLLGEMHLASPLALRHDVAMISPGMHDDFAHDCADALGEYARAHGARSAAANLCGSFRNRVHDGIALDDAGLGRSVDFLLASPRLGMDGWC